MKKTESNLKHALIIIVILAAFGFSGMVYSYESILKFELKPGPYAVGFKSINNYDYTRTFFSAYDQYGEKVLQRARPIQTSIWYPADIKKAEKKEQMPFIEYAYLMAHELGERELTDAVKNEVIRGFHLFFSTPESRKQELTVITNAVRNGEPASGTFPLVVYGPSINSVSFENSILFEHLASHGYIVVSSPCLGAVTRYIDSQEKGAEAQARDILFLLGYMQNFPGVDKNKIALMGFSWGGMSNVLAAMRDSRIDAVISIDGSIAYNKYVDEIASQSLYYDIDKMTMPLLFLRSKKIPEEIMKKYGGQPQDKDKFFEDLKYSDAYYLRFNHLLHGDFCSAFIKFMDVQGPEKLESSREAINRSYNLAGKYIRCFLDAYLKGDTAALEYLANSPLENGIEDGVIENRFKKGLKVAPTFGEFIFRVKQEGFHKIGTIYEGIKKEFPDYTLEEERLTDLAFQMFQQGNLDEVLLLLRFTLEVFPKSEYAYYGLGEIYVQKGDTLAAKEAFKKAIELNPNFFLAQMKLKELNKVKE